MIQRPPRGRAFACFGVEESRATMGRDPCVRGVCSTRAADTPQPGRSRCSGALCRVTDVQAHSVSPEFSAVLRQPRRTDALSHTAAFCRHTGLQGGCLAWYKYPRCSSSGWDSCSSVECLSRGSFCAHG